MPAIGAEASQDVLGERHRRRAVQLDPVVVVEHHELPEPQMPREAGGLGGDPLLEIAIRADGIRPVVDDVVSGAVELGGQPALGDRHAHRVGDTLAKRAGGRLDAGCQSELRVPRRARAPLPKSLQFVEWQVIPGEMEEGVQEHRRVSG